MLVVVMDVFAHPFVGPGLHVDALAIAVGLEAIYHFAREVAGEPFDRKAGGSDCLG